MLGFVPTMGALHAGHMSLVERSLVENARTVVSVFVNPTQFNDPTDLRTYPRTLDADVNMLRESGVDYVFVPDKETVYPDDYRYRLSEEEVSTRLCGAHRPGHFDGVLTVVMRLFNIIRPDRAYFGEKDYQQYLLIADMAAAFFMDIEIRPCPIVRDSDGLALSSRNALLTPEGHTLAAAFAAILGEGESSDGVRSQLESRGIEIDYVEEWAGRRLAAVVIDGVRLIDNVPL
jgi:pantoate--beta-alanine ligase